MTFSDPDKVDEDGTTDGKDIWVKFAGIFTTFQVPYAILYDLVLKMEESKLPTGRFPIVDSKTMNDIDEKLAYEPEKEKGET